MNTFPAAFPGGVVIAHELWYALDPAARYRLLLELAEDYGVRPVGQFSVDGDLPDFGGGPGLLPGAAPAGLSVEVSPGGVNWWPVIAAAAVGLVAALAVA